MFSASILHSSPFPLCHYSACGHVSAKSMLKPMYKEIAEWISYLEFTSFFVGQRGSSSWSSYRVEISVCAIKYDSTPALGEEDCTMGRFL